MPQSFLSNNIESFYLKTMKRLLVITLLFLSSSCFAQVRYTEEYKTWLNNAVPKGDDAWLWKESSLLFKCYYVNTQGLTKTNDTTVMDQCWRLVGYDGSHKISDALFDSQLWYPGYWEDFFSWMSKNIQLTTHQCLRWNELCCHPSYDSTKEEVDAYNKTVDYCFELEKVPVNKNFYAPYPSEIDDDMMP